MCVCVCVGVFGWESGAGTTPEARHAEGAPTAPGLDLTRALHVGAHPYAVGSLQTDHIRYP